MTTKQIKAMYIFNNKLTLLFFVFLFLSIIIFCIYFVLTNLSSGKTNYPSEVANSSKKFKSLPIGDRETQAKLLLPYLKVGMPKEEVQSLLGNPDSQAENKYYDHMNYTIARSNMITIYLDKEGHVKYVDNIWKEDLNPIERVWPLLCVDMTKQDILIRLGKQQKELKDGKEWQYQYRDNPIIFTVIFDENDKVTKLEKTEIEN